METNNQEQLSDQEILDVLSKQDNASTEIDRIGEYVTTQDVVNDFGVTKATVYRWIGIGALTCETKHNPYDRYRITTDSFNELQEMVKHNSARMLKYAGREFFGREK